MPSQVVDHVGDKLKNINRDDAEGKSEHAAQQFSRAKALHDAFRKAKPIAHKTYDGGESQSRDVPTALAPTLFPKPVVSQRAQQRSREESGRAEIETQTAEENLKRSSAPTRAWSSPSDGDVDFEAGCIGKRQRRRQGNLEGNRRRRPHSYVL